MPINIITIHFYDLKIPKNVHKILSIFIFDEFKMNNLNKKLSKLVIILLQNNLKIHLKLIIYRYIIWFII